MCLLSGYSFIYVFGWVMKGLRENDTYICLRASDEGPSGEWKFLYAFKQTMKDLRAIAIPLLSTLLWYMFYDVLWHARFSENLLLLMLMSFLNWGLVRWSITVLVLHIYKLGPRMFCFAPPQDLGTRHTTRATRHSHIREIYVPLSA